MKRETLDLPAVERTATLSAAGALSVAVFVHAALLLRNPLGYIPDDGLFYYQIADNVVRGYGVTFSRLMPTNGFHPLWLLVCIPLAWLSPNHGVLLQLVAATVVALNTAIVVVLWRFLRRIGTPYPAAAIMAGMPFLFFVTPGMEGHIAALLFSLLVTQLLSLQAAATPHRLYLVGLLAGATVVARLDLAIMLAPLGVWVARRYWRGRSDRVGVLLELAFGFVIAAAPVIGFLAANAAAFGDVRPISGALKMLSHGANTFDGIMMLFLALAVAGAAAAWFSDRSGWREILSCIAAGMLLFLAYVLTLTSQAAAWYYCLWPVAAIYGAAALLKAAALWFASPGARGVREPSRWVPPALAMSLVVGGIGLVVRYASRVGEPYEAYESSADLGAAARQAGIVRVLTFDRPGELAYLHGLEPLAADGLTTNLPFQREVDRRGLAWALRSEHIQAIVVPRIGTVYKAAICQAPYSPTVRFSCTTGPLPEISRMELISRTTGRSLGGIELPGRRRLRFSPDRGLEVVLLEPPA